MKWFQLLKGDSKTNTIAQWFSHLHGHASPEKRGREPQNSMLQNVFKRSMIMEMASLSISYAYAVFSHFDSHKNESFLLGKCVKSQSCDVSYSDRQVLPAFSGCRSSPVVGFSIFLFRCSTFYLISAAHELCLGSRGKSLGSALSSRCRVSIAFSRNIVHENSKYTQG